MGILLRACTSPDDALREFDATCIWFDRAFQSAAPDTLPRAGSTHITPAHVHDLRKLMAVIGSTARVAVTDGEISISSMLRIVALCAVRHRRGLATPRCIDVKEFSETDTSAHPAVLLLVLAAYAPMGIKWKLQVPVSSRHLPQLGRLAARLRLEFLTNYPRALHDVYLLSDELDFDDARGDPCNYIDVGTFTDRATPFPSAAAAAAEPEPEPEPKPKPKPKLAEAPTQASAAEILGLTGGLSPLPATTPRPAPSALPAPTAAAAAAAAAAESSFITLFPLRILPNYAPTIDLVAMMHIALAEARSIKG